MHSIRLFAVLSVSLILLESCTAHTPPYSSSYTVPHDPQANGIWWNALSNSERVNVTIGMISAYWNGANDGRVRSSNFVLKNAGPDAQKLSMGVLNLYRNPKFSKPVDAYVQSVSQFYKQYPDIAKKASVGEVLGCLADDPISPCAEIPNWYRHGGTLIPGG